MWKKLKIIAILVLVFIIIISYNMSVFAVIKSQRKLANNEKNETNYTSTNNIDEELKSLLVDAQNEIINEDGSTNEVIAKTRISNSTNILGGNGVYRLAVGANSGKVVEVAGSNTGDNAKIDIWDYGNVPAQKFNIKFQDGYYIITARHTGKSLTVKDGNLTAGAEIVQATYKGLDSQKWVITDSNKNGLIISLLSNPDLSIAIKGNIANGAILVLENTEYNNNQMFYIFNESNSERTVQNGIYKLLVGADSNKAIEIIGNSLNENVGLDIIDCSNRPAPQFNIEYNSEGYYKIISRSTGKSLSVKDGKLEAGAEIVQSTYEGLDSQKWIIRDSKINGLVISLLSNPELSIAIQGNIANGAKLILAKSEYNNNQMFYMFNESVAENPLQNGVYRLAVGANSSKVIEVAGSNTGDNAKVDIWDYGNAMAQKFNLEYNSEGYYKITARHTGKSLTVKDGELKEGAEIVQSTYEGLDSQKWIIRDSNKNGLIISLKSNSDLSIAIDGNIENGAKLVLAKSEYNNNQMFYIFDESNSERLVSNGVYRIAVGASSGKAMEVAGSNKDNNAKVDIWDYGNAMAQKFNFEFTNGYYKITARHTGKSLTVKNGNLEAESEIVQSTYEGLDSQKWIIRDSNINGLLISPMANPELSIAIEGVIENGAKLILTKTEYNDNEMFYIFDESASEGTIKNGVYTLAVGADSNKVIEVAGSSTSDNAKIDIWDNGNVDAQRFNIEFTEGYYKITARHTGKSLTVKDGNLTAGEEVVQSTFQGLDSQKWIIRDSNINGLVISLMSNPELSISIQGNIENGSKLILAKTEYNNNQMFYLLNPIDKNIKEGLYGKSGLMYKGSTGNYLKYYQIGNGSKHLFAGFSIHGFEDSYSRDGSELTYMANEFFEYLKNNMSDELASEWTVYILPVENPDGQYNGWTNNGPGRTTVYSWAPGNQGIDMNRCFPVGYTRAYTARNYNGTEPLQAYEAQSLRDFILNNAGSQNIVLDIHGWLNETIGDDDLGRYYRNEIGISKHIGTYGNGYLIQWARTIPNTKSMLLELPEVKSHSQFLNMNLTEKFISATMKILEDF